METLKLRAHVDSNGILRIELPQFSNNDVEIIVSSTAVSQTNQMRIFDLPNLKLDVNHSALQFLSREDLYGDDGR